MTMDKKGKSMRMVLLIFTVINALSLALSAPMWFPISYEPIASALADIFILMAVITVLTVFWLAKVLKTLNGVFVVIIVGAALYFTRGYIFEIGRTASEAIMAYIHALDNDTIMLIQIFTLYIGYFVLVAIIGLFIYVAVAGALFMLIASIFIAVPIILYHKVLPQKFKAGLHHVAYALTIAFMTGTISFVVITLVGLMRAA